MKIVALISLSFLIVLAANVSHAGGSYAHYGPHSSHSASLDYA